MRVHEFMHLCAIMICILCVSMYVCIHVSMRMYVFIPIFCLKQCIVGVSETCRLIFKVYLFVFALFLDKQV